MNHVKATLALGAAVSVMALCPMSALSVSTQPWQSPAQLTVSGVQLDMTDVEARTAKAHQEKVNPQVVECTYQCDSTHHVRFVTGGYLSQGQVKVASWSDGVTRANQELGKPFATGHDPADSGMTISFYQAGEHWVIMRHSTPPMFSRGGPMLTFGMASGVNDVPDKYWGRDILQKAVAAR